jgi:hypothetical protein
VNSACQKLNSYHKREHRSISTVASIVIVVVVLALVALFIGAIFLTSHTLGGSSSPFTSSSYSSSVSTSSSIRSSSSGPSSSSYQGTVNYSPSCFALYSGAVHVFGTISPATSGNVKSVKLYWSYHDQNNWTWLNDLTYGPSFSNDGNFSHMWNPPEAAYYDFEANWTLASGQVITGITSQPFQVVAQGSSCP